MVKLIVLFRGGRHRPEYSQPYNDFLMKLEALPGIHKKTVNTVYGGPGGYAFRVIVEAFFDNRHALESALTSPEGIEAGNLLHDFAGADAIILFADALEADIHDGQISSKA